MVPNFFVGVSTSRIWMGNWDFEVGEPLNSTRTGLSNHQISKISLILFWSQIYLWVFQLRGFEWKIGISKRGALLNSTRAGLLIHQTSKISKISSWFQISLWMFHLWGFEWEIGVFKHGRPLESIRAWLLNHLISKNSLFLLLIEFFFCALVGMALKVGNKWKKQGWWIQVDATQKHVLWITSYTVVEGRYWSTLEKSFGEILTISPSRSADVLITMSLRELQATIICLLQHWMPWFSRQSTM